MAEQICYIPEKKRISGIEVILAAANNFAQAADEFYAEMLSVAKDLANTLPNDTLDLIDFTGRISEIEVTYDEKKKEAKK